MWGNLPFCVNKIWGRQNFISFCLAPEVVLKILFLPLLSFFPLLLYSINKYFPVLVVLNCIFLNNTVHKLWTKRTGWFVIVCVSMYWCTVRLDFWNGLINGEIAMSVLHTFWGKKGYCRPDLVWPCGLNDNQNVDQVSCAPGDYLPVQIHPKAILFIYSWTTTRCETKCGIWQWWSNLLQKCTLGLTKTSV